MGHKGIYVFESKNYSGHIYGDGRHNEWLVYTGGKKNTFYSPLIQNTGHVKAIQYHLKNIPDDRFFSVIIFSARCKVDVKNIPEGVVITKRDKNYNDALDKALKQVANGRPDALSDEDVKKVSNFFRKAQRPDDAIRNEHLKIVRKIAQKSNSAKSD